MVVRIPATLVALALVLGLDAGMYMLIGRLVFIVKLETRPLKPLDNIFLAIGQFFEVRL